MNIKPIAPLAAVALCVAAGSICDLEALSDTAGRLRRSEFLIVAAPEPVPGATL